MNRATVADRVPRIVGIGGTRRPDSSTAQALRIAMSAARAAGAHTELLTGAQIDLPVYDPSPGAPGHCEAAKHLIEQLRQADGVLIATPAYHAGLSGLLKNAIDYIEALRPDVRPYLDGRAVGCIVTAAGWQGAVMTLNALRSIVHSLRGWPTPLGVAINTSDAVFAPDGSCRAPAVQAQLHGVAEQVVWFARRARD